MIPPCCPGSEVNLFYSLELLPWWPGNSTLQMGYKYLKEEAQEPGHARPSLLWLTNLNYSYKLNSWFGGYLNSVFKHFSPPWAGTSSLCQLQEGCSAQDTSFLTRVQPGFTNPQTPSAWGILPSLLCFRESHIQVLCLSLVRHVEDNLAACLCLVKGVTWFDSFSLPFPC